MDVEVFTCEEAHLKSKIDKKDEAAILQKIDDLNLSGQKELLAEMGVVPDGTSQEEVKKLIKGSIIPFKKMSLEDRRMWGVICPAEEKLTEFSGELIPLRVLEVISICNEKEYFNEMMVFSEKENKKDPILVGITHPDGKSWDKTYWLVARWGEVLENMDTLFERAKVKAMAQMKVIAKDAVARATQVLDDPESAAIKWLGGDSIYLPGTISPRSGF